MNPIQYILNRVANTIPFPILEEAFEPSKHYVTLDERIREEVIIGRVLPDCNLFSGKVAKIVLRNTWLEYTTTPPMLGIISTGNYSVYRVPPDQRDHRKIVAVTAVDYPPAYYTNDMMNTFGAGATGLTSGDLSCQAINALTHRGTVYRPTPVLREGNLIYILPPQSSHINWVVSCRLEYDEQFMNIENNSIIPLTNLAECAIKAYIYNRLVLKIDSIRVEGGLELSKFREIVDSYADQEDKYQEHLLNFRGSAILDPERLARILVQGI